MKITLQIDLHLVPKSTDEVRFSELIDFVKSLETITKRWFRDVAWYYNVESVTSEVVVKEHDSGGPV
jgi:hypothetical protein